MMFNSLHQLVLLPLSVLIDTVNHVKLRTTKENFRLSNIKRMKNFTELSTSAKLL